MNFFAENIYTVILVPFWVMLIILFGKLFAVINSKKIVGIISIFSSIYCLIFSIGAFIITFLNKGYVFEESLPFLKISKYSFDIGVYLDGLSSWMLLLAAVISLLVQIYSLTYMKNDKSFIRYFSFLNFFNFSMFGLILSQNLFQMYLFWELVGVSSYLLIGFWYNVNEVSAAAKRAFTINRIGDCSLLAGIILFSGIIHSVLNNSASVSLPFSGMNYLSAQIYGCTSDLLFILICILLLGGAVAKSAQFPLHSWLIDAMKGPTPVSALIHSATMVAAGVFLLVRLYPLFSLNNYVMTLISVIGIVTALVCSIAALSQNDIKKILAYSTSAQLGLMFLAIGCCSVTIGMFHLTSHAFAKAMLFLAAGTVIFAINGNQDIKLVSGLRKKMPASAYTFLVGIFSLSGLLFSGFSSKEMILSGLINGAHYVYAIVFLFVSFLTIYYLFRLYFNIFEGELKNDIEIVYPPKILTVIPAIFAIFVVLIWFILPKSGNWLFISLNYIIAIFSAFLAYIVYTQKNYIKKIPLLFDISYSAFFTENIISFVVLQYKKLCRSVMLVEKYIFNGFVYLCSLVTRLAALLFSRMQTGNVQSYISYSIFMIMISFGGIMLAYSLIIYLTEVQ